MAMQAELYDEGVDSFCGTEATNFTTATVLGLLLHRECFDLTFVSHFIYYVMLSLCPCSLFHATCV